MNASTKTNPGRLQMKAFVGKLVSVYAQTAVYTGVLLACDQHMNVVLAQTVERALDADQKRLLGLVQLMGSEVTFVVPSNASPENGHEEKAPEEK